MVFKKSLEFLGALAGRGEFRAEILSVASAIHSSSARKIVFADTEDVILEAASLAKKKGVCQPVILGEPAKVQASLKRLGISNLADDNILDYLLPENSAAFDSYLAEYIEMKKNAGKPIADKDARENMSKPHYYGAMLVHKGLAHGMVSGVTSATKPYYPAFEIIRLLSGVQRTSGAFIMTKGRQVFFFADCVMNMSPNSEQLAEIAYLTAKTASGFGIVPKVAMLSFSTRDSAKHDSVERVKLATAMLKRKSPELIVDGELQLDAAVDPGVAQKKCPDSPLKGEANVLVFPDLNAANIGYKLVERLGGFEAIGPFLQGLRKPLNDLSRGCSAQDVMYVAAVTVVQSKICEEHIDDGQPFDAGQKQQAPKKPAVQTARQAAKKPETQTRLNGDPLDRLPSNVRKIIEDSRKKNKKESVE